MGLDPVIIKTRDQLKKSNEPVVSAINKLLTQNKRIPLVYQYLHTTPFVLEPNNIIGDVYNIRKDKNGNVIGDVKLYPISNHAHHYQNTIDNILVVNNPKNGDYEVNVFIVYDKDAKRELIEKRKRAANDLPKPGNIPFMSQYGPELMKQITETLTEEYEKLLVGQQKDNLNEGGKTNDDAN